MNFDCVCRKLNLLWCLSLQIPADKHVLVAVRQTNSHKIHIKDQIVKYDRSQRVLKWVHIKLMFSYYRKRKVLFVDGAIGFVTLSYYNLISDLVPERQFLLLKMMKILLITSLPATVNVTCYVYYNLIYITSYNYRFQKQI